jgi:transposase
MKPLQEIVEPKTADPLQSCRTAAALDLGIDPDTIAWPCDHPVAEPLPRLPRWNEPQPLADAEWCQVAGYFPPEPPQSGAITNRVVIDAVMRVVAGEQPWSVLDRTDLSSEAVRKRFARLARKGVWQQLGDAAAALELSESRRTQLRAIARRAR